MPLEIERKFLVRRRRWSAHGQGVPIVQGYFPAAQGLGRVRLAGEVGFLTFKKPVDELTREEIESRIPGEEARRLLAERCGVHRVEKIRYHVACDGHTWDVDVFFGENQGLITAEIELISRDESFSRPAWLGPEVSGDPRFINSNLAEHPFRRWPLDERREIEENEDR